MGSEMCIRDRAIAEVPINIGQMTVGALIALPTAKMIWHAFPQLRKKLK